MSQPDAGSGTGATPVQASVVVAERVPSWPVASSLSGCRPASAATANWHDCTDAKRYNGAKLHGCPINEISGQPNRWNR